MVSFGCLLQSIKGFDSFFFAGRFSEAFPAVRLFFFTGSSSVFCMPVQPLSLAWVCLSRMLLVLLCIVCAISTPAARLSTEVIMVVGWTNISRTANRITAIAAHQNENDFMSIGRSDTSFPDSPFTTA